MTDHDDQPHVMTDAEWAAEMSVHALSRGRIELGYQLAKIAVQAQRHERANAAKASLFGPEHSQPIHYAPVYAEVAGQFAQAAAVGTAPVEPVLCEAHGQPMLRSLIGDDGLPEYVCICTRGGVDQRVPAQVDPAGVAPDPEPAQPADAPVPTSQGRCAAEIVHVRGTEQYREPCRGALYWAPDGSNQDNGTWRHIDPALDAQHIPLV